MTMPWPCLSQSTSQSVEPFNSVRHEICPLLCWTYLQKESKAGNEVRKDKPMVILVSVCNLVEKYTSDTVGSYTAYFLEVSYETGLGSSRLPSYTDEFEMLIYLDRMHKISPSGPFDPWFQGALRLELRSFKLRLPAPLSVLRPTNALVLEYLGSSAHVSPLSAIDPEVLAWEVCASPRRQLGFETGGNTIISPSCYMFFSAPLHESK